MSCDDPVWLEQRIERTKALIVKIEDAIDQLSTGAVQSYTLSTGQTSQTVTKANLGSLRATLSDLESRLSSLCARLTGGSTVYVKPGF